MAKDIDTVLDRLKQKKDILAAKIQKIEYSKKSKERKFDTRKKILVGSYYLDKANKENTYNQILEVMDSYLTRDTDRKLFNLKPKNDNNKESKI